MTTTLSKRRVRDLLGPDATDADVARFFGISASAVSQWPEDDAIPELRQLQAERKRPDLFGPSGRAEAHRTLAAPDGGAAAEADAVPVQPVSRAA